jgi:hypothetical protein
VKRLVAVLALTATACSGGAAPTPPPPADGLGAQAAAIASDTNVLREAQAAAAAVLRDADNCEAVKADLAEAQAGLEKAFSRARTETGRTAITNLKKQVQDTATACP